MNYKAGIPMKSAYFGSMLAHAGDPSTNSDTITKRLGLLYSQMTWFPLQMWLNIFVPRRKWLPSTTAALGKINLCIHESRFLSSVLQFQTQASKLIIELQSLHTW